jgi:hypothetical protein
VDWVLTFLWYEVDWVLTFLWYNEMASTATLLTDSSSITGWTEVIIIFTVTDVFLKASCLGCWRRHILLEHIVQSYFMVSASPLNGVFIPHHVNIYVDGIKIYLPTSYINV